MRNFLALPALLRSSILLASASQHAFSVHDDLLAFPQYAVKFTDDYISAAHAQSKLDHPHHPHHSPSDDEFQVDPYHPPLSDTADPPPQDNTPLTYTRLTLHSQPYLCSIPHLPPPPSPSPEETANSTQTAALELARANSRGWELLSEMQGSCVYFISGWWSYRFCYGEGVKQFHQLPPRAGVANWPPVEDKGVVGFELGRYEKEGAGREVGEKAEGELVERGEARYLVQQLSGGTTCDLTGLPRRVEVQFHCNPSLPDRITLIKETSTCAYLMVLQTPRLCNDIAFLPPQKTVPNAINCTPILSSSSEVEAWRSKGSHANALLDAAVSSAADAAPLPTSTPRLLLGDVLVGARTLLPPSLTLTKSGILGGGKETYVDTIATSEDGAVLSVEEMKKLGLGDPKDLEELRKKLEGMARGGKWKLDVIDTPRGREYRGVIGDEEEEGEQEGGERQEEGHEEGQEEGEGEGSQEEFYREEL